MWRWASACLGVTDDERVTTNRDKVLHLIRTSREPLDDDQLSRQTGITPRQTVNIVCRALVNDGLDRRVPGRGGAGRGGKIVNEWVIPSGARVERLVGLDDGSRPSGR